MIVFEEKEYPVNGNVRNNLKKKKKNRREDVKSFGMFALAPEEKAGEMRAFVLLLWVTFERCFQGVLL